jgi:hypothetical protein
MGRKSPIRTRRRSRKSNQLLVLGKRAGPGLYPPRRPGARSLAAARRDLSFDSAAATVRSPVILWCRVGLPRAGTFSTRIIKAPGNTVASSAWPRADTAITRPVWAKHPFGTAGPNLAATCGFARADGHGACPGARLVRGFARLQPSGWLPSVGELVLPSEPGTARRSRQLSLAVQIRRSRSSLITMS